MSAAQEHDGAVFLRVTRVGSTDPFLLAVAVITQIQPGRNGSARGPTTISVGPGAIPGYSSGMSFEVRDSFDAIEASLEQVGFEIATPADSPEGPAPMHRGGLS